MAKLNLWWANTKIYSNFIQNLFLKEPKIHEPLLSGVYFDEKSPMHDDLSFLHQSYSDKSEQYFGNYEKEQIFKQGVFSDFSSVSCLRNYTPINNKALYNLL